MMKPPNRWKLIIVMVLLAGGIVLDSCQSKQPTKQQETGAYYTCPMHHQIHEDKPGNCPICGMKLIKVASSDKTDKMPLDSALSYLTEPVTQTVVGSFKVIEPVKAKPNDTLVADGYIGFDQRDVNTVSSRVAGRIETLYVRYANQRIHKGQPLMKIYSPDLLSAQRNLLQVMQDKDQTLINSLKAQLINLGMQATEIQRVMQSGQALSSITIYSPYNGISQPTTGGNATNSMASSNSVAASPTGMEMGGSNINPTETMATGQSTNQPEALSIREGMYVNRGQTVFSIQNTNRTWAILNVFTSDVWHIHPGDAVSLYTDADPINIVKGRVDFIPPYRSKDEKTTRIRIYLDHLPRNWKINTLIHGQIAISGQNKGVYVPLSAMNRLGMQGVIWVQDKQHPDVFHARKVTTGIETGDFIQITAGIQPGEKIVENAAYMVDSDSFIQ